MSAPRTLHRPPKEPVRTYQETVTALFARTGISMSIDMAERYERSALLKLREALSDMEEECLCLLG